MSDESEPPPADAAPGSPDGAGDDGITTAIVAAIKDRMHSRRVSDADDPCHLDVTLGAGHDALHVIDDGVDHCMIGRAVGHSFDGCVYVLVGRISLFGYEQLRDGDIAPVDAFSDSRDISLCSVFEVDGLVENIALVRHFRHAANVPAEYLPTHPFLEFGDEDTPSDED